MGDVTLIGITTTSITTNTYISTTRYGEGPSQASSPYTRVVKSVAAIRMSYLAIV